MNKSTFCKKNNCAFTMIELIIYISIVGVILIVFSTYAFQIINGSTKTSAQREVQQNARLAVIKMSQAIRQASGINSPGPSATSTSLSLQMTDSAKNPTVFDLAAGNILRITEGSSAPIEITTDETTIPSIIFSNVSYIGTPGGIRIQMTLDHVNPAEYSEYEASTNIDTTVSLYR